MPIESLMLTNKTTVYVYAVVWRLVLGAVGILVCQLGMKTRRRSLFRNIDNLVHLSLSVTFQ